MIGEGNMDGALVFVDKGKQPRDGDVVIIESADWEERYLCNHWIDKACFGGIVISVIYFATVLAYFFLKIESSESTIKMATRNE